MVFLLADFAKAQSILSKDERASVRESEADRVATIARASETVIAIFGDDKDSGGSGVIIDSEGFALTNHHVVAAIGKKGKAGVIDGRLYDWDLVGTDEPGDIALIRLKGKDQWPFATLGDSNKVRIGNWVMAMGNPFGLAMDYTPTVTLGIVSGIERYQGGQMVYGNCIQADCAINPGNSGGPLMNLQGEVIGINGRAAFASRGRVNVGVGFAVSSEQVKNFIPELMSARAAQHGTLDAQFSMREGKVICEAINLDSRAARAGLQLGDRILSLNGTPIKSSNQLASLISMQPCNWPVQIEYERENKRLEFSIRLSALNYVASDDKTSKPEDPEAEVPEEEKEQPKKQNAKAKLPQMIPGSVLSTDFNRANANRLISRWRNIQGKGSENADPIQPRKPLQLVHSISDNRQDAGKVTTVISPDGRFSVTNHLDNAAGEQVETVTFFRGGTSFLQSMADQEASPISLDDALADPFLLQAAVHAARFSDSLWNVLGDKVALDGGDFLAGQRAYRIRVTGKTARPFLIWLSMDSEPELLKVGFDEDGTSLHPAIALNDCEQYGWLKFPKSLRQVMGVQGVTKREWTTESFEAIELPAVLEHDKP